MKALIETFGSINSKNNRKDGVSYDDVVLAGLMELDEVIGLDNIDQIVTGMTYSQEHPVTDALENGLDELGYDGEVMIKKFYANVSNIAEEDDIEYNEAWKKGMQWRNRKVFTDDNDAPTVNLAVRFGDAGPSGMEMLRSANRKGITTFGVNLDELVDRDVAYGDGDDEGADSGAEAAA